MPKESYFNHITILKIMQVRSSNKRLVNCTYVRTSHFMCAVREEHRNISEEIRITNPTSKCGAKIFF